MDSIIYDVPWLPPTPNQWMRMHWAERGKIVAALAWEFRLQGAKAATEPCEVDATWRVWRKMDSDNAHGRLKPVLDALVDVGVLSDDNGKVIAQLSVQQVQCKIKEQGVHIEIRECLPFSEKGEA